MNPCTLKLNPYCEHGFAGGCELCIGLVRLGRSMQETEKMLTDLITVNEAYRKFLFVVVHELGPSHPLTEMASELLGLKP